MTREEALEALTSKDVNNPAIMLEALDMAIKALEQEPCEDEYIKVPKKALKYRTAGMVAYNVEWLKNHFDMERTVICGEQEPNIKALGEDMRICQESITDEKVLIGFNMAVAICNKYFAGSEEV